jgi:hypothetical protein
VTLHCGLQLVLSKTLRIGDTKYISIVFSSVASSPSKTCGRASTIMPMVLGSVCTLAWLARGCQTFAIITQSTWSADVDNPHSLSEEKTPAGELDYLTAFQLIILRHAGVIWFHFYYVLQLLLIRFTQQNLCCISIFDDETFAKTGLEFGRLSIMWFN